MNAQELTWGRQYGYMDDTGLVVGGFSSRNDAVAAMREEPDYTESWQVVMLTVQECFA